MRLVNKKHYIIAISQSVSIQRTGKQASFTGRIASIGGDGMRRLFLLLALLAFVGEVSAAPNVTSWSNNKTNDGDIMFLVNTSDVINFNATVNESVNYTWTVNKTDQTGNYDNFTFTIPPCNNDTNPSSCIWEIHLKVSNANGEDHIEWVVSTLSADEAPDFFDYFTDTKISGRTETDPWGRPLQSWSDLTGSFDISRCFHRTLSTGAMQTDSNIAYGTWKFKYRMPKGNTGLLPYFQYDYIYDGSSTYYQYWKYADAHHHCQIVHDGEGFSIDYDSGYTEQGQWHEITIIRNEDGWLYVFLDNEFLDLIAQDTVPTSLSDSAKIRFFMKIDNAEENVNIDCLEIYDHEYLFPEKDIEYSTYIWNYYNEDFNFHPLYKNGIIVKGRNVTLSDINSAINNSSLFTYDSDTKTAIAYTDLVVYEGAELIIKDDTLKFHCSSDGDLSFVPKFGSSLLIENSTIASNTEYYFLWNLAGSTTHYGHELRLDHMDPMGAYYRVSTMEFASYGRFIVENSVIDNFAHLFFDSPYELNITDSQFTNMHEIDIGNYTFLSSYYGPTKEEREFAKGNKSVWILFDDLEVHDFVLRNVTFSSAGEESLNLTFLTNAYRDKYNIYDINAENETIIIKESLPLQEGQSHSCYDDGPPYQWKSYIDSGIGLVNCKFDTVNIASGAFTDCDGTSVDKFALVKYYLDVKVVDGAGNPVSGAVVNITNEVDVDYQTENMVITTPYATSGYSCTYHHYRFVDGQLHNSTTTGIDGHTPLPSNITDVLVAADYYKNLTAQINFTYNITVSKGAQTATTSGININDTWHRTDPEIPTMTITCNLSTGTCDIGPSGNGNSWSPSNKGNYYNFTNPIEITIKGHGDRSHIFSRTPTQSDNNTTSFKLEVKTI